MPSEAALQSTCHSSFPGFLKQPLFFVEDKALLPITHYKSFRGRITVKQKLSVDDKRLKTGIVKGLRRLYYKNFIQLIWEYLFL